MLPAIVGHLGNTPTVAIIAYLSAHDTWLCIGALVKYLTAHPIANIILSHSPLRQVLIHSGCDTISSCIRSWNGALTTDVGEEISLLGYDAGSAEEVDLLFCSSMFIMVVFEGRALASFRWTIISISTLLMLYLDFRKHRRARVWWRILFLSCRAIYMLFLFIWSATLRRALPSILLHLHHFELQLLFLHLLLTHDFFTGPHGEFLMKVHVLLDPLLDVGLQVNLFYHLFLIFVDWVHFRWPAE